MPRQTTIPITNGITFYGQVKMIRILGLCLFIALSNPAFCAEKTIRVNDFSDPNAAYAIKMLKLAIFKQ
jgi:hypothetical protein